MDPLSITTGVFSLLAACVKTGIILKNFYDSVAIADTKVKGLLTEVESFTQVLHLMKDTLEQENIQTSSQATGHIDDRLKFLATSIQNGQETLLQLQETIEKVNKSVSVLDSARKHLRLRSAADEIAMHQQKIRSYRDIFQLIMQAVIFSNQYTFRKPTDKILPNLDDIRRRIRRTSRNIDDQIDGLQNVIESKSIDHDLHVLNNLRDCIKSAASIVSSASTIGSVNPLDRTSVAYESDFGDCFQSEPMLRWISSNSVYESEEDAGTTYPLSRPKAAMGKSLELVEEGIESNQSDSDGELEAEIIQSLLRRGKDKLESEEFEAAERHFRNCLTRASSKGSNVSLPLLGCRSEIMTLLLVAYRHQEKWEEARSVLTEKIALESRGSSKANQSVLADTLILVEVLLKKCAYTEALLYGRRALKSYRKLGSEGTLGVQNSLRILCQVCKAAGNHDEEDAYGAILSDILQRPLPAADPTTPPVSEHDHESVTSSKMSRERAFYMEGPSVQSVNTPDTPRSNVSWVPSSQSTPTSPSISAKTHRRYSSLSSFGSTGPASPYTEYSSSSTKSQERLPNVKDPSLSHPEDTSTFQSPLSTFENIFKQQEGDDKQVLPTNESTKYFPLMAEADQVNDIQQPKDDAATSHVVTLVASSSTSPLLHLECLEHQSEPLRQQNGSQTLHIKEPTTPVILLPASDQTKNPDHPKLPVALESTSSGSRPSNTIPKQHPGLNFSHLMANHALKYLEENAIKYFRAKKGNPPKPVDCKPRNRVPVSDYELLQWIGTHPDFPFVKQSNTAETLATSAEIRPKTLKESKSAIDLFNSGILELPTELPPRSKSVVNLPNSNSTDGSKSKSLETTFTFNSTIELDNIFAGLGGEISTGTTESTTLHESDTTLITVSPRPKDKGVLIDAVMDEDDDHNLKKLIEMGYPRIRAVSALERHEHDLERALNYLLSEMSEEPSSPRTQTDIQSKHMGVIDPFRFYVSPVFETIGNISTSASNRPSSFESPPKPVSFQDLVQLQSSALSADSHLRQLGPTTLTSHRSESGLAAQAKSHKKSRSFDSGFSVNHNLNTTISERRPSTAESRQDKLSENARQLEIYRPRNPIAPRWDADSYIAVELAADSPCISNDLMTNPSVPLSQNEERGTASRRNLSEGKLQGAFPDSSPTRPPITFSEMLNDREALRRKVVISGDIFCGKSSLVSVFSKVVFPERYHSTELDIRVFQEKTGSKRVELELWDTSGDFNDAAFRLQCYPNSHLVMICFAIDSPDSLDNAEELFITELKKAHISAPYMLVGLKKDLRYHADTIDKLRGTDQHPVTPGEGEAASTRIRALKYMECSAKTGEGVKEVFGAAADLSMLPNEKLKKTRSFRQLFGKE